MSETLDPVAMELDQWQFAEQPQERGKRGAATTEPDRRREPAGGGLAARGVRPKSP